MKFINVQMKFKDGQKEAIINPSQIAYVRADEANAENSMVAFDSLEPIIVMHSVLDLYEMISKHAGGRPRSKKD